ncbi:chorismate lyase [Erwinia sp. OLTSP20]|uniref:chorismate lyase n=1 Tax=unclassified Erwinia TaxID=2622719 RepID=UPI000C1761D9|nr:MULTISPECIES: chorismate lyase [unclassified Erwinia]PIJ48415.1 chorismate lyase [Erwinia sp. OAMSP11]PIJ68422.1 chorismate lyase [Erwinia sp. OLSSP12]PIJ79080.1 chorismate lyase [Erwinia sp. OLCASP19]PIJ79548.1 chorismate lyase [Erwinia sp. OLMTSP26]PIJ81851.1 chorismate lyase [Erwinia sp. OLMDSP33]
MSHPALKQLYALRWAEAGSAPPPASISDWLMEEDSMTRRFEQFCQRVSVRILRETFVTAGEIAGESALLPQDARYWLREVLLCGDDQPWLVGRTLVPQSTLSGPEKTLQDLGNRPLGRYLFASSTLTRDFIEVGRSGDLWGRRSRLRISGKPLLLNELFLPSSPLYRSAQ